MKVPKFIRAAWRFILFVAGMIVALWFLVFYSDEDEEEDEDHGPLTPERERLRSRPSPQQKRGTE